MPYRFAKGDEVIEVGGGEDTFLLEASSVPFLAEETCILDDGEVDEEVPHAGGAVD